MEDFYKHKFSWLWEEDQTQLMSKLPAGYPIVIPVYSGTNYVKLLPTQHTASFVHDLVLDLSREYTIIGKVEATRLENVRCFVSDHMKELPEWGGLSQALKLNEFEFACGHPCFWSLEKRRNFVDYAYSIYTSEDEDVRAVVYKAMSGIDVFDYWRRVLDDPHEAPLKRVLDKCGIVLDMMDFMSVEEKRWVEGGEMMRFMKNCYDHLTSVEIGEMNQRCYTYIDFTSDDPLYKDIEFFNHMVTHFLYPKLWIELYAALYNAGYKFESGGIY